MMDALAQDIAKGFNVDGIDLSKTDESDNSMTELMREMLNELVSRDILYEPFSVLAHKFPLWLQGDSAAKLNSKERSAYEAQMKCAQRVVAAFDSEANGSVSLERKQEIFAIMQEMQEHGNPPEELLKYIGKSSSLFS